MNQYSLFTYPIKVIYQINSFISTHIYRSNVSEAECEIKPVSYFLLQTSKTFDYEHSEMLLYQNEIMIDGEMYKEALEHLKEFESQITDKVTVLETKGKLW